MHLMGHTLCCTTSRPRTQTFVFAAPRPQGRLRKDVTKLAQEKQEMADKVAGLQTQIFRANEKLDGFKLLMNWNQEELEQWALAERQKEEDNAALEKYRHADAAKVGRRGRKGGGARKEGVSAHAMSVPCCGTGGEGRGGGGRDGGA